MRKSWILPFTFVYAPFLLMGAQWLSGRVLDSRPRVRASRARHIYLSLVLVQPRKSRPCLTERLLMGRKESNQTNISSLQCYSVLSDNLVKNELCIPLERGSNILSTGEGFICLSPPSKLKVAVRFCFIYKKTISFSAIVF